MRIVSVCRAYPTHRPGGMLHVVQDRAEALAALGHEVHVLTTAHDRYGVLEGDVTVHHLPATSRSYSAEFAELCHQECERLRPEIIHLDSFDVWRLWWDDRPGGARRVAITMHGFGPGAFLTAWNLYRGGRGEAPQFNADGMIREANALAKADVVIGTTEHEAWYLSDWYGLKNGVAVPNPIPSYFFDNPTEPAGGSWVCAAISGQHNRGFDLAERACREVGAGFLSISKVPRREMPKVYDSCCGLIVPTFYAQCFDLTIYEALARRRPVICSDTASYGKEAEKYSGVYTFKTGNLQSLVEVMRGFNPPPVPLGVVDKHRPENHAKLWLEAIG
jgi:glycosyltransferase involved in cell wall biosynthesis